MKTVRTLLSPSRSLHAAAATAPGTRPIAGRGIAYALPTGAGTWLVRHYRRGGAFARVLGDRYFAWAADRALRELQVSAQARAAGIATPEVLAAVRYQSGLFTRFDIAVAWIDGGVDLAQLLFEQVPPNLPGAIARAASLIETICQRGLLHADLNLKNILVTPTGAYVLDLDRCHMSATASPGNAERMRRRFARSLEKWEGRSGRTVAEPHRRTLLEAFRAR